MSVRFVYGLIWAPPVSQVDVRVFAVRFGCTLISGLVLQTVCLRALMEYAKNDLISSRVLESTVHISGLCSCGPTYCAITRLSTCATFLFFGYADYAVAPL